MWIEEECYPSEPVFVASPDAVEEDDGEYFMETLDFLAKYEECFCGMQAERIQDLKTEQNSHEILDGSSPSHAIC